MRLLPYQRIRAAAVWFGLPTTCLRSLQCLLPLVQAQATEQYEQEFEAFQSGKYKESAQNWLQSSWQGDALQACHILYSPIHPSVCLLVHLSFSLTLIIHESPV